MVSYSRRLMNEDKARDEAKKRAGGGFTPLGRRAKASEVRKPCRCNGGRIPVPKFLRTTKTGGNGCGYCGGDGWLDPGDKGYGK